MDKNSKFGLADYAVVVATQLVCLGIGAYYGRKGRRGNLIEFALANRKVPVLSAGISIFATCGSAVSMTVLVGEQYMYGSGMFVYNLCYGLSGFFVAYAIIPVFFKIPYISVYEYVERRFNKKLRTAYVILYIIQQMAYMSVVMYIPAISLTVISGIPYWTSLVIFSTICIIYSTLGGMIAVIRTDFIQAILMFTFLFIIIFKGSRDVGGFKEVWQIGIQGGRIGNISLQEDSDNRYSLWALMFGGLLTGFSFLGTSQAGMQRSLSVKGCKEAQISIIIGSVLYSLFSIGTAMVAVILYANFRDCEPTLIPSTSGIKREEEIVVYYITTVLSQYPGVAGLAMSGILSGCFSSLSSFINTFATITVHDLITPNLSTPLSGEKSKTLCKCLNVIYGIICTLLSMAIPYIGQAVKFISTILGVFGGPLAGIFFMGMFIKRVNIKGALSGLIVAVSFVVWMAVGNNLIHHEFTKLSLSVHGCNENVTEAFVFQNLTSKIRTGYLKQESVLFLYKISFIWYLPIGFIISVVVGILISFLTKPENTDSSLLSSMVSKDRTAPNNNGAAKEPIPENELLNQTNTSI